MTEAAVPRQRLSRERIYEAALDYIEGNCVADLSMRKLGAELGVEAMALYWHVPSKAALMDGLAETLLQRLELPAADERDWEEAARRYARSVRRLAAECPRIFPLLASLGPRSPVLRRNIRAMRRLWRNAGFDERMQFRAGWALHGYVMGATLWEVTLAGAAGGRRQTGSEQAFEFGLEVVIRGLADALGEGEPAARPRPRVPNGEAVPR